MSHETGETVVNFEDVEFVLAALDSFIGHYREIDAGSETTDVSASAAIRRAADARQQLEEDFLLEQPVEVRSVAAIGSTILRGIAADEFAEALRMHQATLPASSDDAKRVDYLAQQLEG